MIGKAPLVIFEDALAVPGYGVAPLVLWKGDLQSEFALARSKKDRPSASTFSTAQPQLAKVRMNLESGEVVGRVAVGLV